MWKNVLAGVLCVGAVGFSLAVSRGDNTEDSKKSNEPADVLVPKDVVIEAPVKAAVPINSDSGVAGKIVVGESGDVVEVRISADADIVGDGVPVLEKVPHVNRLFRKVIDPKAADGKSDVLYYTAEGAVDPATGKRSTEEFKVFVGDGQKFQIAVKGPSKVSDPGAREVVEKLVKHLEDTAAQLEKEGKKDEAGQKRQSAATLRMALEGAMAPGLPGFPVPAPVKGTRAVVQLKSAASADELKKLTAQLEDLHAAFRKQIDAGNKEEAAKVQDQIARIQKEIARVHGEAVKQYPNAAGVVPSPAYKREYTAKFEQAAPSPDEMKKLTARLEELQATIQKLASADTDRSEDIKKTVAEIGKIHAEIAQRQVRFTAKAPILPPVAPFGARIEAVPGGPHVAFAFVENPEAEVLSRRADVLRQAAGKLKEAGLGDQARELGEQADQLQKRADELRKHAPVATGGVRAMGRFPAAPPMELLQSIKELQEQVQVLRKEVAGIRELLEKKK